MLKVYDSLIILIEGSLVVKLPTIWIDGKARGGKSQRGEQQKRKDQRKGEKKEDGARKGRKVEIHCVFPMICGSGGSKSRLVKGAGAETSREMRNEKLHAVAAQSTFPSQNAQNTPCSEHFWKLRCRKSARSCGAKHGSKSKCAKHTTFRPLSEVEMSKKCTPLWREAHFEVTTFGRSDVVSRGQRKGLCTLSKTRKMGQRDRQTDRRTDGRTDRQTDKVGR